MGGGDFHLFDILIFAVIAGVLFLRLRRVLGKRTGMEKRINPFAPRPPQPEPLARPAQGPVIEGRAVPAEAPQAAKTPSAAAVKAADAGFDDAAFIKGARAAFEIVVNAFAAGDSNALRPLLSPEVFESFAAAIKARGPDPKQPSPLVAIKRAEITASEVEGATAMVTVKFVSDQTGAADRVEEHVDFWTFSRRLETRNPNWTLTATKSPDAAQA